MIHSQINILITDDKEEFRRAVILNLKDFNIKTMCQASNGVELLSLLETVSPDVILLDLSMPKMDGNHTMNWLIKKYPEIKIIIYSFFDEQELIEDYFERGAKGYVSKSSNIEQLVAAIQKVYKGGKYKYHHKQREQIKFTPKNKEYIHLLADGKDRQEIATELGITPWGVDRQKKKLMLALGEDTYEGLLRSIYRLGFNFFGKRRSKFGR